MLRILGRLPVVLIMAYLSVRYLASSDYSTLIDTANLALHEGGHLHFFYPMIAPLDPTGGFIHFLGGTFAQLAFPALFGVYFLRTGQYFAVSVMVFWLGQNCIDIAPYAGDARARALPLIFENGTHDWWYMLGRLDLLAFDKVVARAFYLTGALLFALALLLGTYTTFFDLESDAG